MAGICCVFMVIFSEIGLIHGNNAMHPDKEPTGGIGEITLSWVDMGDKTSPTQADPLLGTVGNESWRFAVAYAMLAVFCAIHFGLQKKGLLPEEVTDDKPDSAIDSSKA